MNKLKNVPIANSNIANIGTDLDKKVRENASNKEDQWLNCGKAEYQMLCLRNSRGIEIWRIEDFKVVPWPKDRYGQFFSGDSYIVLKSTKSKSGSLSYDLFFWLGQETSQDEAGTAAYKTVELDDHFGGRPSQHREIQGFESSSFLSLFPKLTILQGGVDSGFHHVKPTEYKPRLLSVKGKMNHVHIRQVPLDKSSMNSGDVFVLDAGTTIYQWNGTKSNPGEKSKGAQFCNSLEGERHGLAKVVVLDDNAAFWGLLGGKGHIKSAEEAEADDASVETEKVLYRLSRLSDNNSKDLNLTLVAKGKLSKSQLDSNDAFIVDTGVQIYVWVGKATSPKERSGSLQFAMDFLQKNQRSNCIPIAKVFEGHENAAFESLFH